jgi:two-component system cell cycle sensor histidine kinase/response regulator CckA
MKTILIVDDEALICSLAARVLRGCGYTTLEARDGTQALQLVEETGASVDLVVTDLVMPGLGGVSLIHALRKRRPSIKVLVVSGYGDFAQDTCDFLIDDARLLPKPFEVHELCASVRKVLDAA